MPGRIVRMLRSRQAALWLLASLTLYLVVVTAWPHSGSGNTADVWSRSHPMLWRVIDATGLSQPYVHPLFLASVAWLVLATGACAWERTRWAAAPLARPAQWRASLRRSTAENPELVATTTDVALAAARLSSLGLRVEVGESGAFAASHRWAFSASPTFHWALAGLLLIAALGQLTRAEGSLDIAQGESAIDRRSSYVHGLAAGPLFAERFSEVTIGVESIAAQHVVDGVDRGASPLVTVRQEGRALARAYIYPNAPMRVGGLLLHRGAIGPAVRMRFDFPDRSTRTLAVPFELRETTSRPVTARLDLRSGGQAYPLELVPASAGRLSLRSSGGESEPIGPGATVQLPGGVSATFIGRTSYARLLVANDPTVPWLYGAFAIAIVSAGVALLIPPRAAVVERMGDGRLGVRVVASTLDSAFRARVHDALAMRATAGGEE